MSKNMVNPDEVRHMAKLSRLNIDDEEVQIFATQFSDILTYMNILQKTETAGVSPLFSPLEQKEWQRDDVAENRRTQKEILTNAPETDGQYFIVPKIV